MRLYISTFNVLRQSLVKTDIFVAYAKKTKKDSQKDLF
jgi:hypothetical protein